MLPSKSAVWKFPVTRVALFVTATTPFSADFISRVCEEADEGAVCSDGRLEPIRLTLIDGDFRGWTPLRLAREHVIPNFTQDDSPFACVSFVILDEKIGRAHV